MQKIFCYNESASSLSKAQDLIYRKYGFTDDTMKIFLTSIAECELFLSKDCNQIPLAFCKSKLDENVEKFLLDNKISLILLRDDEDIYNYTDLITEVLFEENNN